jgi:neurotransmitter:Na+ symporter, NSS family
MGHAFFTLSIGMGAMITYGSYLGDDENLPSSAIMVAVLDTMIAIMASIAIYTILFKHGLDPTEKATAGLVFQVLPLAFGQMWGGQIIGTAFFLLLSFAAMTSAISLLEVVIAYFIDDRKWARKSATLIMGAVTWGIGVLSALSYSTLKNITPLSEKSGSSLSILDSLDLIATNYMLPIGGFFIALFAGYYMTREDAKTQIMKGGGSEGFFNVWNFLIRYVTPVMVAILFMFKLNEHLGIWK